jgi:hypothetical protein
MTVNKDQINQVAKMLTDDPDIFSEAKSKSKKPSNEPDDLEVDDEFEVHDGYEERSEPAEPGNQHRSSSLQDGPDGARQTGSAYLEEDERNEEVIIFEDDVLSETEIDYSDPDAFARAMGAEPMGPASSGGAAHMPGHGRPGSRYPSKECPDCQGKMAPISRPGQVPELEWLCLGCKSRFDHEDVKSQRTW